MKFSIILLFFITLSGTSTCKGKKEIATQPPTAEKQQISSSETYIILSLNGNDISEKKLTITFNEERKTLSGNAGCNSFSCGYTLDGETIAFGFPRATKMYCEENHKLEHEFMVGLQQISTRTIQGDSLFLMDKEQNSVFTGKKLQN